MCAIVDGLLKSLVAGRIASHIKHTASMRMKVLSLRDAYEVMPSIYKVLRRPRD